jgi:hypothetical protein
MKVTIQSPYQIFTVENCFVCAVLRILWYHLATHIVPMMSDCNSSRLLVTIDRELCFAQWGTPDPMAWTRTAVMLSELLANSALNKTA